MTQPDSQPVTIGQLRESAERVAAGFTELAGTMVPSSDVMDTSARIYALGTHLREFGELLRRFHTGGTS